MRRPAVADAPRAAPQAIHTATPVEAAGGGHTHGKGHVASACLKSQLIPPPPCSTSTVQRKCSRVHALHSGESQTALHTPGSDAHAADKKRKRPEAQTSALSCSPAASPQSRQLFSRCSCSAHPHKLCICLAQWNKFEPVLGAFTCQRMRPGGCWCS